MNNLNENVNDLILQLDPDYCQCSRCKKYFHKNVILHFFEHDACPLCQLKEDEGKNEIPIKTIEETMEEFNEKYQNNSNFLNDI